MMSKHLWISIWCVFFGLVVCVPGSSVFAKEWYEYYEEAEKAIALQDWETAIGLLHQAIEADPNPGARKRMYGVRFIDYFPYLKLGEIYLALGDMKEAYNHCKIAKEKGAAPDAAIENCLTQVASVTTDKGLVFIEDLRGTPVKLPPSAQDRGKDVYAVIIGIDKYQDSRIPPLRYAVNDARVFYDMLTDPQHRGVMPDHIQLLLGQEATDRTIKKAIGTWLRREAGEEDTVIIYYSGHGAPEGEKTYWVTYNADIDDLYSTALSNNEIADMLAQIKSKRIITFLDSCYSEATVKRRDQTKNVVTEIPLEKFTGEGRVVISASDGRQLSVELHEYQHGVFTYYLLKGLKREADANNDGVVVVDEIWDYIKEQVPAAAQKAGNPQTPVLQGRITTGIPLTVVAAKTKEERLRELFEQGIIDQEQYECALQMLDSSEWIKALMSGEISEEFFGRMFQCQPQ
jgi:tetratricopeptide (TPR) repeat protein